MTGDPERSSDGETPPAPPPAPPAPAPETHPPVVLRGTTVSPGLVLGRVHRKDHDLASVGAERVALDEVENELNRLRAGLDESRRQLLDLRSRLKGRVHEADARILDTHLAYLKDSVFIADVENLILNEQMRLEAAIAKVVADFDRIFRLVENETLRQSAVDLRDVGIRVLRNLERAGSGPAEAPRDYVLVAKELSIVDMFDLSNEHVKGIVTKEGGVTSHAAIFARSMGIPTLTGIDELLEEVAEDDFVILDATEGVLRVNPDGIVRAQYADSAARERDAAGEAPGWAWDDPRVGSEAIEVTASAGNLPEVEQAVALGLPAIGLYRTELLYLVDPAPPSRDALRAHYAAVLAKAGERAVTFRLLSLDSSLQVRYVHEAREANPALGRVGVRALLARGRVLRRQMQALLLASERPLRLAVPFVNDCGELRRVKEILFEERLELRRAGEPMAEEVALGVVVETPAAMLGIRDLAQESDFLLVNLDALQQYLLAADRDNAELAGLLESPHPFVLRALAKACEVARAAGKPLSIFGVSAVRPESVPLFYGIGLRSFCVAPIALRELYGALQRTEAEDARAAAREAMTRSCPSDGGPLLGGFRHGYAPPG